MKIPEINLDDEEEVMDFVNKTGNLKGRAIANDLGMHGKGSTNLANFFAAYAHSKMTAINARKEGKINLALYQEKICDNIYKRIPETQRPW